MTAEEALSTIKDPRVRQAMRLRGEDWTQAQIADYFEVSEKTVERMIANERARPKKRGIA
ncbi:sigma-70 region 4 domain-containing protein [Phycicoccus sp. KQZ13P-1]|uniref:sigma-70 region 4 domain-containing protein n=1 Tax=Phycicoccus mangrovi TaxID=2840470 RepID=UPI001C0035B9|nr:sigma-70 region 4 domain-containing protein [Phycicoccus mangrovi]MBT9257722.1 sigma-70 region 4 domain-containing protein [Phycicoccus mangrovi]